MKIVREVDAGPMLGQTPTPIDPLATTATLTERIARLGADLLLELLPGWVAGEIDTTLQDEALATHAPRLSKLDGTIDWSLPAVELWRRVRAFQPWPLASTSYRDLPLTVHEAWPLDATVDGEPGSVIEGDAAPLTPLLPDRRSSAVVACGEGSLALLRVQRPGRRALEIEQYLNGDLDLIGSRLG